MLAVHAFWEPGRGLCLWAEDAERTVRSQSQALRTARPHPFAAPAARLVDLHAGKAGDRDAVAAVAAHRAIGLP